MGGRRRIARVPASSANLGSGYDVLGIALEMELELEVAETGTLAVHCDGLDVPDGRDNLIVRAFERLYPADGITFTVHSEIPLTRGLGSSAAAIVAGLLAADHMYELGNSRERIFAHACELEGHADNVAAALFGGVAACAPSDAPARRSAPDPIELAAGVAPASEVPMPARLEPPEGLEAILAIPADPVSTSAARAALPAAVPIADAVHNLAAVAQLVLGIERSDLTLIERGLSDHIQQPRRASLYPRSIELLEAARELGAIGATISGAGPTVLVWAYWQSGPKLIAALDELCAGWADVIRVPFSPHGARVELP